MWGLIALCCTVEAVLFVAGLVNPGADRAAYLYGGFWAPLIRGTASPVFPGQTVAMFATYGVIHSGVLHLAMNMISLLPIARELNRAIGAWWLAVVYAVCQIAAALLFAAMAPQSVPMVGASGAIFGLAGALVAHAGLRKIRARHPLRPLIRAVVFVLAINIGLTLAVPDIAWQAHLGGGLAGLAMGTILSGRRRG